MKLFKNSSSKSPFNAVPNAAPPSEKPRKNSGNFLRRSLLIIADFFNILTKSSYNGDNAAIASVYTPLRYGIISITAISLITLVFGAAVPIDSAAIAHGTVAVMSKRKTVQHLEGGIIKTILVADGQIVQSGQILIEMSDIAPKANRDIIEKELWQHRAAQSRLLALQQRIRELVYPPEMEKIAEIFPDMKQTMQTQHQLFAIQRDTQQGKIDSLVQRIEQSREEIKGLQAQVKSSEIQLEYIQEEIAAVEHLLNQGLATKPRMLALQRAAEELRGNRGQNLAMIARARQTITQSEIEVENQENDFDSRIAEEWREVQEKIADGEEKLRAADDVMERTIIVAPTEGIVTGLKFHTIGGVVAPGAPILEIVPQNDALILEVKIKPNDIDVVKPGLDVHIVFSAYKTRKMPVTMGKVTQISADAFTEQLGGQNVSYYSARVEVTKDSLAALDKNTPLQPGMPAEIYIKTGARSFLSYLLQPVTESMTKAFKEE